MPQYVNRKRILENTFFGVLDFDVIIPELLNEISLYSQFQGSHLRGNRSTFLS